MKLFPGIFAALLSATVFASNDGEHRFYGYAYDLDTGVYLYTEVHAQKIVKEKWVGGTITYYDAAGVRIGHKTLDFSADIFVPLYRLDLPREGYFEAITANGARIEMKKRESADAREKSGTLEKTSAMAGDSGFHSYLVENFETLQAGKPLRFRLVVAGNLDSYKFKAQKTGDTTFEGRPAIRLLIEADSLLSFIADPLDLVYDAQTRQLLEYRGLSNMHDPASGKPYDVRIVYPSTPPPDAPKPLPPLR